MAASMGVWLAVVPVVAKTMQEVGERVSLNIGGHLFVLNMTLPFAWQSLFWAAVVFLVGNLIVQFACPRLVLEHGGFGDFKASGKLAEHLRDAEAEFDKFSPREQEELLMRAGLGGVELPGNLSGKFWKAYSVQNIARAWARRVAAIVYLIGFALLVDVLWKQIGWVVRSVAWNAYLEQLIFWPAIKVVFGSL